MALKSREKSSATDVPKKVGNLVSRTNEDGTVAVMSLELDDSIYSIDGVAAEVWDLIDGKRSIDQICRILLRKHSVSEERLRKDAGKLITSLRAARLIEVKPGR